MHDLLFRHQDALREKYLFKYAGMLGLDIGRFCWELKNRVYRERVRRDFRSGVMNGVYSTPTVFINGVPHSGALNVEVLLDVVTGSKMGRNMRFLVWNSLSRDVSAQPCPPVALSAADILYP